MPRFFLFAFLLSLSLLPVAFGQPRLPRPFPKDGLETETESDPPAYIWRTDISPGMISQHDTFTSYQVNVNSLGQNFTGDAANEPSICLDPTNRNKMAIGWRQFNTVTSSFRQGGWGYTTNGGTSWTFPGSLQNGVFRSDPVLLSDFDGTFFYLSLIAGFQCDIWRSSSGGQFWTYLAPAVGGDKQWLAIDTTNSSGRGFQYQSWSTGGNNYGGRQFSRSTNGGFTWMDPIFIPNTPSFGTLDVDSNGNLFIGGLDVNSGGMWCVRSSNAKNAAVTPTFDQSAQVGLGGDLAINTPINPEGLVGQIFLAVDRSGNSTNNYVYMLASVIPYEGTSASDVMFARSTDGGQSFSAPHRINDDHSNPNKWHWLGTMSVAPNGRIDSVWLDTRNAANNTDSQLFYSYSADGGVTWSPNVSVSNSFNPFLGYPVQAKMGDYITMVSDNGGGNVAYTATFNGEEDIYYVRVVPAEPQVSNAASRKTHGAAGVFDIPLPLSGPVGIECRGGPSHQLVVNFADPVTVDSASVSSGNGSVTGFSVSGSQVIVNLNNVSNAQRITVTLAQVHSGPNAGNVSVSMGVLAGDVNGNGSTNATDISLEKSQAGQPVTTANFRTDGNFNGAINTSDVSLVKANAGTVLP